MNFLTTCLPNIEVLITVKLADDIGKQWFRDTRGKMLVILKGKFLNNGGCLRVPLQEHMSPIHHGSSYSATCYLPHGLKCLESVGLVWRRKQLGNLFGSRTITITSLTIIPVHDKQGGRQYVPSHATIRENSIVSFSPIHYDVNIVTTTNNNNDEGEVDLDTVVKKVPLTTDNDLQTSI